MRRVCFSPELTLAAACCRWPRGELRTAAVRAAADAALDWPAFLAVVQRHRIEALAHDGLTEAGAALPEPIARELFRLTADVATQSLRNAAEEGNLGRLFEAAGIDFIVLKGATLACLAYGSLVLKSGNDIDILIAPASLKSACALLAANGYQQLLPEPSLGADEFDAYMRDSKETAWFNPRRATVVDLHIALVQYRAIVAGIGLGSPRQEVKIERGLAMPTLARDPLFSYLCVHGAQHHWQRLKWLADLAAYAGSDPREIERLHGAAIAHGAGRSATAALALCNRLFDTPALASTGDGDAKVARLVSTALAAMTDYGGDPDFERRPANAFSLNVAHALMKPGLRYKLAVLDQKLFYPYRRRHLRLSRWLRPLYTLLLLPGWWHRTWPEKAGR